MFILCLIGFFSIKSCCLVCFLHAFARKVVFDERIKIDEAKKNAKAEAKAQAKKDEMNSLVKRAVKKGKAIEKKKYDDKLAA